MTQINASGRGEALNTLCPVGGRERAHVDDSAAPSLSSGRTISLAEENGMADREQQVRERAYAIWEQEGRPDGEDREHWLRAEAEIAAEDPLASNDAGQAEAQAPSEETGRPRSRERAA